jgi:sugar lactone lactonase YvrE
MFNSISKMSYNYHTLELPTSDPGESGRWWVDTANGRVVKVSQG